eukprot:gnl/TRDRNA2_/TRDRNA2_170309_c4_seq4.p2 gnl/TRDRNA2_/TRDRNA2_170309_c4~~gnl/TRDRNA2_/TRDRNA2_170309_c4_seq4.p2  ORF type:complete len:223 (+),score=24.34 gnl/TRDRNA2_/TRDRNA2_170309_c4_seq4:778-1446(+)
MCLPHLVLGSPAGTVSYANYCYCWRREVTRLAGREGARTSQWVRFLEPHHGPEMGLLIASLFIYRGTNDKGRRGFGALPLTTWSRERHHGYVDAWLPPQDVLGGSCALLPLVLHWASLPWRPRLIYDFMHRRFPNELPMSVLVNGSAEEIAAAYRAAGARGLREWQNFRKLSNEEMSGIVWPKPFDAFTERLEAFACNIGSNRMWSAGGFTRFGRTTRPYAG